MLAAAWGLSLVIALLDRLRARVGTPPRLVSGARVPRRDRRPEQRPGSALLRPSVLDPLHDVHLRQRALHDSSPRLGRGHALRSMVPERHSLSPPPTFDLPLPSPLRRPRFPASGPHVAFHRRMRHRRRRLERRVRRAGGSRAAPHEASSGAASRDCSWPGASTTGSLPFPCTSTTRSSASAIRAHEPVDTLESVPARSEAWFLDTRLRPPRKVGFRHPWNGAATERSSRRFSFPCTEDAKTASGPGPVSRMVANAPGSARVEVRLKDGQLLGRHTFEIEPDTP